MKKNKDMRNISLELGRHFIEECSYDLAVNALTKAIALDPHNAQLYDFRGIAYGSNREHDEAITDFNMAIISASLYVLLQSFFQLLIHRHFYQSTLECFNRQFC